MVTTPVNATTAGQSVTFTATVSVVSPVSGMPTGTVTFSENGTSLGTGTLTSGSTATFVSSTLVAGTYTITASYGGDTNFSSSSGTLSGGLSVGKASPTITTQAAETGGGLVGETTLTDTATLAGGYNPGGTISFSLTDPSGNPVTLPANDQSVPVSGNGAYTTPTGVLATVVGTYVWSATYNGDSNNNTANELVTGQTALVSYQDFSSLAGLTLNGNTQTINASGPVVSNGAAILHLTTAADYESGGAFLTNAVPLTDASGFQASFSTFFEFQMSNAGGIGDEDGPGATALCLLCRRRRTTWVAMVATSATGASNQAWESSSTPIRIRIRGILTATTSAST